MGTLACRNKEGASLQQELKVLKYILSGLSVENQACVASLVQALHSNFTRIDISLGSGSMSHANKNAGIMDVKKNLRCLYEMMSIVIMDNNEIAQKVKSMGEVVSYTSL